MALSPEANASSNEASNSLELDRQISALIEQLGSDHYAARRQAQERLQQIGVPALDQLQAAILHSDPQVASAARFMVRSSFINWTNENDPLDVRKLLEHYGTEDVTYRVDRIARLAALPADRGLPSLLRIARYEVSGRLSRLAALSIMDKGSANRRKQPGDPSRMRWETVLTAAAQGKNQACQWLAEYAGIKTSAKELDAAYWLDAIGQESQLLRDKSTETSRDLLVAFSRFVCELLAEHGRSAEALQVGMSLLDIEYDERNRIYKAIDLSIWALDRGFPTIVIEQCQKPWLVPIHHAHLDYLRAESYQRLGETKLAAEFSERAFTRGNTRAASDISLYDRKDKAEFLHMRQQYAWAEREYRSALQIADPHDDTLIEITDELAKMLIDGLDYAGAVEVMRPLVERFEKEPAFAREVDRNPRFMRQIGVFEEQQVATFTESFRSLYLHFRATDRLKAGLLEEAKKDLREALKADPDNIDIVITMWRNRDDANWNRECEDAIQHAIQGFRDAIAKLERGLRSNVPSDEIATYQRIYANTLNTYAWILACTDRDLETAVECSQLACRLQPNTFAYIDTLARCYFKVGRIEEAIKTQSEAVALEPAAREIARTLAEYQMALPK